MSEAAIEPYEGMNQPPLTSANRPDLAALPAYVEPPREVTKVDRRKNSAFAILAVALGAGVCGGIALNEYKQRPPTADMPFERFAAAPAEAPSAGPDGYTSCRDPLTSRDPARASGRTECRSSGLQTSGRQPSPRQRAQPPSAGPADAAFQRIRRVVVARR